MMENRLDLLTQDQIDWCDECVSGYWYVGDDGKVYSRSSSIVVVAGYDMMRIPVKFGDSASFDCDDCTGLVSLEGSPDAVTGFYRCSRCYSLRSLDGASRRVGTWFSCNMCSGLRDLKGSPEFVGTDFDCSLCRRLVSLEGFPRNVGRNLNISNCSLLEKIGCISMKGETIDFNGCPRIGVLEKVVLNDQNLMMDWKRSKKILEKFIEDNEAYITGKRFGI